MRNLTCIVCPVGCTLDVDEGSNSPSLDHISVTGNKCPRGVDYAREEICAPKRVVTATCPVVFTSSQNNDQEEISCGQAVARVPVKTASPCPREKIPALLEDIYKTKVTLPVKAGDIVIANWKGEGIDVVATRSFSFEPAAQQH